MVVGFAMRPLPLVPQARSPLSASIIEILREVMVARLAWVAGLCHMPVFMAGAMRRGARVARAVAVRMSSASPWASLAITLAVQGAMIMRSARSAREMWSGDQVEGSSNIAVVTGLRERVRSVRGVMKRVAPSVMTTHTWWLFLTKRRVSSHAL